MKYIHKERAYLIRKSNQSTIKFKFLTNNCKNFDKTATLIT